MKMFVTTANEIIGFHNYPNAPESVSYLRYPHRHIFHIACKSMVSHGDREIEIFTQESEIESYLTGKFGNPCMFGQMSCEMIAVDILNKFHEITECKVTEDGKGGAIVQR